MTPKKGTGEFSKIPIRRHPLVFFRIGALGASTLAILLRKILTSNPNGARACLRVQAQPARL